ncbi:MAG: tetratricopeptide repeat protein [Acidobacteriota bacterium]|jgi:uncharacterized protein (AIM24 family)
MPESIPRGPFDQGLFLAHYNKGRELFEAHKLEEAERELEEAYLLRPRDVRVLNLLGLIYFRQEKLEKAEEVYRKLIAESPDAHTLHYNLGLICNKLERFDDAESAFLKALELTRGNPKINFYLGSIYERTHRYKDAIYQYRQAGASLMVQRVEGKMGGSPAAGEPAEETESGEGPDTRPPRALRLPRDLAHPELVPSEERAPVDAEKEPAAAVKTAPDEPHTDDITPEEEAAVAPPKAVQPVSSTLMADSGELPGLSETARFQVFDDTLPPGRRARTPPPKPPTEPTDTGTSVFPPPSERQIFRTLEKGLMEVDFSGKVFIKQGTIYSYSGNLTFWVKDRREQGQPALVIVTGTGRLLLTDQERDITLTQVGGEAIYVEPSHLLACEEGLQPRYVQFGDGETSFEAVMLEGSGMVALSVGTKPLPLTVRPALPVSVPAAAVIMWAGDLVPGVVDDPQVYEVVLPSAVTGGRLLRLEGSGRVLVEQASA